MIKSWISRFISAVCPGIRGQRTHGHAQVAIAIYLFLMVVAILQAKFLVAAFLFALANQCAAQGTARWTLRAIEQKVDLILKKHVSMAIYDSPDCGIAFGGNELHLLGMRTAASTRMAIYATEDGTRPTGDYELTGDDCVERFGSALCSFGDTGVRDILEE